MENKDILNFICELGMLRRAKNEGLKLIGISTHSQYPQIPLKKP